MDSHSALITEGSLLERYKQLCELRDKHYEQISPIREKLDNCIALSERYRVEAQGYSAQINTILGGENWLALKKEIGIIAKMLGRKDGVLAVEEPDNSLVGTHHIVSPK